MTEDIVSKLFNIKSWHSGLVELAVTITTKRALWFKKPNLKYIFIKVDVRDGNYLLFDQDLKEISREDLLKIYEDHKGR